MACSRQEEISQEDFINYVSDPPSLQSIAVASIAVQLWGEVNTEKCRMYYNYNCPDTEDLEKEVLEKLAKIPLPSSLKYKVSNIIRHIGVQWLKWNNNTDFKEYLDIYELCRQIGFACHSTMEGTFDRVKLLKNVISSTMHLGSTEMDFSSLYKLACHYCLDECTISNLWLKVRNTSSVGDSIYKDIEEHLVAYWTFSMENNLSALLPTLKKTEYRDLYNCDLSIAANMVTSMIFQGNVVAFKYFWWQLSSDELNANIERWFTMTSQKCQLRNGYAYSYFHETIGRIWSSYDVFDAHTDIMCFLLSHMHHLKQKEVFRTHSEIILDSLLFHWPLQRFFTPTIAVMLDYLQEKEYVRILAKLLIFINVRVATREQAREVWYLSPLRLRKAFVASLMGDATAILPLLKVKDMATIDMILKDGSDAEKKSILFRMVKHSKFYGLLWSDVFDTSLIDALASKFLSSHSDLILFKKSVALEHTVTLIYRLSFDAAEKLLDWAFQSPEQIKEFKKEHINPFVNRNILKYIGDKEFFDKFLKWYFDTVL